MVTAPRGFRQDTRRKLSKHPRWRGKISISRIFQEFKVGDFVSIDIEPSFHEGMPHPRYKGREGIIIGKQGECYVLLVRDGGKLKKIISHPVHLKRTKNGKLSEREVNLLISKYEIQKRKAKNRIMRIIKLLKQKNHKKALRIKL